MSADPTDPDAILRSLGLTDDQAAEVRDGKARLVVVAMTAHLDWDWLLPFPVLAVGATGADSASGAGAYFAQNDGPATNIFAQAAEQLADDPAFRYSVCEMGFLRAFAEAEPTTFQTFVQHADRVHLCGAGITSPDSLLPHVEAFIRNYLVGRMWAAEALPGATISQSYVPDDFGHDVELPGTLAAMGIAATAFARLPGVTVKTAPDGKPPQAEALIAARQVDFVWPAAGDAAILAHWMPDWYSGQGTGGLPGDVYDLLTAPAGPNDETTVLQASDGAYVYMGLGNDFGAPIAGLPESFAKWNASPQLTGVFVALGTFDDFVRLTGAAEDALPLARGQPYTIPYFTGCHATRPALKILHQRAVRALLAAEALTAAVAGRGAATSTAAAVTGEAAAAALLDAWNLLVPSTHHDFITGTAHPHVYRAEQLPLLRQAVARAEWLRDDAAAALAALVQPPSGATTNSAVTVFNPTPYAGAVLAECRRAAIGEAAAVAGAVAAPTVQTSAEGRALFLAEAPALGYAVAYGNGGTGASVSSSPPAVGIEEAPGEIVLCSGTLRVTLTEASGWGIASVLDGGRSVFPEGVTGNDLVLLTEGAGDEYRFAPEAEGSFTDATAHLAAAGVEILEREPLRARVRTMCTCDAPGGGTLQFVREYAVVCGEPFLRMSLTGAAPAPAPQGRVTDVAVRFPLTAAPTGLLRGTPGHWTDQMPQLLWQQLTSYAPHHFTIPSATGGPLLGILHPDSHAWGLWSDTGVSGDFEHVLYGILLRNTDGNYFGWSPADYAGQPPYPGGTDADTHTVRYALLPPSACSSPAGGDPFLQAARFAAPPLVTQVAQTATEATVTLPHSLSFAATVEGPAAVTVLKPGSRDPSTLVLRLHHPAPGVSASATVAFDPHCVPGWDGSKPVKATLLTALEEPAAGPAPTIDGTQVTVAMPRAIATVGLSVM